MTNETSLNNGFTPNSTVSPSIDIIIFFFFLNVLCKDNILFLNKKVPKQPYIKESRTIKKLPTKTIVGLFKAKLSLHYM